MKRTEVRHRTALIGILITLLCSAACPRVARAQFERTGAISLPHSATVNYRFAEPTELPITVTLLGAVRNPGRYEISRKIDLVNLLGLAGGWTENADLSEVHISRLRDMSGQPERFEIALDLEEIDDLSHGFVQLQENDCIHIGVSRPFDVPLLLSIVSASAAVATAIFYVTQINN